MLHLNPKIASVKPSATLAINEAIKQVKQGGQNIAHLGFGQAAFPVPRPIVQALQTFSHRKEYLPNFGLSELRQAVAQYYQSEFAYRVSAEQVIIGPGSKELIFQLLYLIEGELLLPAPSWVSYAPQADLLGKPYRYLTTNPANNYVLDAQTLEAACQQNPEKSKILILNFPNNPTGSMANCSQLKALADVCKRYKVWVISDEIYAKVQFDHQAHESIQMYYPEGTIVTGGLSKLFAAGGYRLGVACVPEGLLEQLMPAWSALISETFSCVATPIQYAAVCAYGEFDRIRATLEDYVTIQQTASLYLYQQFQQMGFDCPKPAGAFYLMPSLAHYRSALAALNIHSCHDLAQHWIQQAQVATLPGQEFGMQPSELCLRIAAVDFDGATALQQYHNGLSGSALVKAAMPQLHFAAQQLEHWQQNKLTTLIE